MRKTTLNQKTNYLCRHTSITPTKTGKGLQKLPQNADRYRWEMMDRHVFKTLMKMKILVNFDDLKWWFGLTHVADQVRWLFSEVAILKLSILIQLELYTIWDVEKSPENSKYICFGLFEVFQTFYWKEESTKCMHKRNQAESRHCILMLSSWELLHRREP